MTLGYPKEILPYPAIEYIPLSIHTKRLDANWQNNSYTRLYLLDNQEKAKKTLNKFRLDYPQRVDFNNNLLLLLLNAKVEDIYYRGYKVQMIGETIDNSYHLFTITKKYFYKNRLIFNFFLADGQRILKEPYQL